MADFPSFTEAAHRSIYPSIFPSRPSLSAVSKVIFITGGAGGIGKEIAAAFIAAGAKAIILVGRTEATLKIAVKQLTPSAATSNTKISYIMADITDKAAIDRAFSVAIERYGQVDVLINNAGYLDQHKKFANSDLEDYWRSFEINIKGPINTTSAFLKVARPGATLINTSSIAAFVPYLGVPFSAYSASKLGAAKIMEYIHHEEPGLRVFNLHPGFVDTDMATKGEFEEGSIIYDEPGLPGAYCVWLASPESEFLRGRFLWPRWDVDEMKAREAEIKENHLLALGLRGWP